MYAREKLYLIAEHLIPHGFATLHDSTLRLDGTPVAFVGSLGVVLSAVGTPEHPSFGDRYPHVEASADWCPAREARPNETAEALAAEILTRRARGTVLRRAA